MKPQKRKKYGNIAVDLNMAEEDVTIFVDGIKVAKTTFVFDGPILRVTDVGTEDGYEMNGYGRMMFDVLKNVARQHKMPIYVWSLDDAIPFYEKLGFLHLNNPEVQKKIIFGNLTNEDINKKIDDDDLIWIPQSIKGRPLLYL